MNSSRQRVTFTLTCNHGRARILLKKRKKYFDRRATGYFDLRPLNRDEDVERLITMDQQEIRIPIETALYPAFYRDFKCLADACRDHCCGGWAITFDKKDYLKLRRLNAPPDVKQRLEGCVKRMRNDGVYFQGMYAEFRRDEHNNCPMLDSDRLCALQKACGHEALPAVCKIFPRGHTYTSAAKELTLSPACEVVMKRMWELPDGIDFIEDPLDAKEVRRVFRASVDKAGLVPIFPDIRSFCIDILQNRLLSMKNRMLFLGIFLQKLMELDWDIPNQQERYAHIYDLLKLYEPLATGPDAAEMLSGMSNNTKMFLSQNISLLGRLGPSYNWVSGFMAKLVTLVPGQENLLRIRVDSSVYLQCKDVLREQYPDFEIFFENLIVAVAWDKHFPVIATKEGLWKSYVELCNIYSFYRFCATMQCGISPDKDELIHTLVMVSRAILHDRSRQDRMRDELFKNDSASLAHMAILVGE